jgi:YegS/Rv2252/BmrU family lipid kinase
MLNNNNRILMIVNPVSGNGKAIDMAPEVERILNGLGATCDIQIGENADRATALASAAANLGYRRLIVLGGDGTCNAVAKGIYNSDVIMGIIPGGKKNDFFHSLGITGGLSDICKIAAFGPPTLIDIGFVNDTFFINNFSGGLMAVGIDTNLSSNRFAGLKRAYHAWKKYESYDIALRIDNLEINLNAAMIMVNIGKFTGGWPIAPQAINNDGKFDVCVVDNVKKSQIPAVIFKLRRADHFRLPQVRMYRCRQLEISGNKEIPVGYDGEIYQNVGERLMIKCEPQSLKAAVNMVNGDEG